MTWRNAKTGLICMQVTLPMMSCDFTFRDPVWFALLIVLLMYAVPTVLVCECLRREAVEKGYRGSWGWMGLLAVFGSIVVDCLPSRAAARRGFEVIGLNGPGTGRVGANSSLTRGEPSTNAVAPPKSSSVDRSVR
jgi:hypothetical protein